MSRQSSILSACGLAAALAVTSFLAPRAQADGLDALHAVVALDGKVCFSDHSHHGSGSHAASKTAALKAAIDSWAGFVAWEYGAEWANIKLAESRGKSCSQEPSGWSCSLNARPCRRQ